MISKADLITVCKKMPGFVRVACEIIPGDKNLVEEFGSLSMIQLNQLDTL